jgi:hypothetical protein
MRQMLSAFYARPLIVYLIAALVAVSAAAGPAEAMLLPASPSAMHAKADIRAADRTTVQKVLESATLRQKLLDYGLTPEMTEARLSALSDEELHRLATNLDAVQAGGDGLSALFALVVIAALVVLIIFLLEGRIEIQKK